MILEMYVGNTSSFAEGNGNDPCCAYVILGMTMIIIAKANNTKADTAVEGAARRRLPRGRFELMNNERCMKIICIIGHFNHFVSASEVQRIYQLIQYSIFFALTSKDR
jgi:hypothetical protein